MSYIFYIDMYMYIYMYVYIHWSFNSAYFCHDFSNGVTYCLKYLKRIYVFIDKRYLFKPLSYETFCDLPIWYIHFCYFTCNVFAYILFFHIYISVGFLVGEHKKNKAIYKEGGRQKRMKQWYRSKEVLIN